MDARTRKLQQDLGVVYTQQLLQEIASLKATNKSLEKKLENANLINEILRSEKDELQIELAEVENTKAEEIAFYSDDLAEQIKVLTEEKKALNESQIEGFTQLLQENQAAKDAIKDLSNLHEHAQKQSKQRLINYGMGRKRKAKK